MDRQAWLEKRRHYIGGSDAASIIGLNPYVTPFAVWADKTGRMPDREDNEAMRQGRDLEGYVAQRFMEETGKKVRRCNEMLLNAKYPFAAANIDRAIIGEKAGLECKSTSSLSVIKLLEAGEIPNAHYVQCVHYMAIRDAPRWYLAELVLGKGFYIFTIERDEAEIQALMTAEQEFWETYVVPDVPPPVDGLEPTSNALNAIYKGGKRETMQLDLPAEFAQYIAIKRQISELDKLKKQIEQKVKKTLGDAELGECGPYRVIWVPGLRRTLDTARLAADHPDIDLEGYYKNTVTRPFLIREVT